MGKRKSQTVEQVLETLPDLYSQITFRHFEYEGMTYEVRARVRDLHKKPPLYLWCVSTWSYASGLIQESLKDNRAVFRLDLRLGDKRSPGHLEVEVVEGIAGFRIKLLEPVA